LGGTELLAGPVYDFFSRVAGILFDFIAVSSAVINFFYPKQSYFFLGEICIIKVELLQRNVGGFYDIGYCSSFCFCRGNKIFLL